MTLHVPDKVTSPKELGSDRAIVKAAKGERSLHTHSHLTAQLLFNHSRNWMSIRYLPNLIAGLDGFSLRQTTEHWGGLVALFGLLWQTCLQVSAAPPSFFLRFPPTASQILPIPAPDLTTHCTSGKGVRLYLYGARVKFPTCVMLIEAGPQSLPASSSSSSAHRSIESKTLKTTTAVGTYEHQGWQIHQSQSHRMCRCWASLPG